MNLLIPPRGKAESSKKFAKRVLRKNIMNLRLQPGEVLNEAAIAEVLEMSRTPVHEAIAALHEEWLVDIFPQKGTRVSQIDPMLVKEGYRTRLLLEGNILKESAGTIEREQMQEMLNCLRRQDEHQPDASSPESIDIFIELDDDFHRMMYYFAGRCHTWMAIRGLVAHYDRLRHLDAMDGECQFDKVRGQHHEFCDFLLMGLPEGVDPDQKVCEHLVSFRGNLLGKMEQHPGYFTLDSSQN